MKLQDIQEASYHRHFPILTWLKGAFEHQNAHNGVVKILSKEHFEETREVLFDQLGEPSDVDGENVSWYVANDHGRFYVDLQDILGVHNVIRHRLTVTRLDNNYAT
jgi:hypothetical protein